MLKNKGCSLIKHRFAGTYQSQPQKSLPINFWWLFLIEYGKLQVNRI